MYTGCIRPIMTYGAEVWLQQDKSHLWIPLQRLQNSCLRSVTGAYRGSSSTKNNLIANVEPLDAILQDLAASWASRMVKTGDPLVRAFLESPPARLHNPWHDGSTPHPRLDSPISRAFHISDAPPWDPPMAPLAYGDSSDTRSARVTNLTIFEPSEEASKSAATWNPHL